MLRRFSIGTASTTTRSVVVASASSSLFLTAHQQTLLRYLTNSERDDLSRVVSSVQGEAKGQSVDLSDMADATRNALKQIQEASKRTNFTSEPRIKAKVTTLQTSLKAYSGRIANVQNEARSLQNDAEKVLKLLYDGDASSSSPHAASSSSESTSSSSTTTTTEGESDFGFTPPETAQRLEEMNEMSNKSKNENNNAGETLSEEEIVVETVDQDGNGSGSGGGDTSGSAVDDFNQIKADETNISEITSTLHEKGIEFSDCREAKDLRRRYKEYLDGKFNKPNPATQPQRNYEQEAPKYSSSSAASYQDQQAAYERQQQQQKPNTTETGLAQDPYPNATRKQIDTQRFVRDVKAEIAAENGISPDNVDLWSGVTRLEDHKRLYEYPSLANSPIEVRQKGDFPSRR